MLVEAVAIAKSPTRDSPSVPATVRIPLGQQRSSVRIQPCRTQRNAVRTTRSRISAQAGSRDSGTSDPVLADAPLASGFCIQSRELQVEEDAGAAARGNSTKKAVGVLGAGGSPCSERTAETSSRELVSALAHSNVIQSQVRIGGRATLCGTRAPAGVVICPTSSSRCNASDVVCGRAIARPTSHYYGG